MLTGAPWRLCGGILGDEGGSKEPGAGDEAGDQSGGSLRIIGGGGSGFNLEVEPIDFSNGVGVVTEWKTGVKHNAMDAGLSVCRATSGVL